MKINNSNRYWDHKHKSLATARIS